VSAQEEERLRLSRELHDGTGQMLATALVNLKVLERLDDPAATPGKIAELRAIIVQTLEECRRLAMDLRPAGLDDLGLPEALDWLARDFEHGSNVAVNVVVEGLSGRLARPIEVELYRIAQEMLANVAKHSRATRVVLRLTLENESVSLVVEDDGIGFDAAAALARFNRGLGLLSMRERAELLGGSFNLESTPGRGTRIRITVPAAREVAV
jgi:two-component system sensor histidine kinase UhpB